MQVGDLVIHIDDEDNIGIIICVGDNSDAIEVLWNDGEVLFHGSGYYLRKVSCK